MSRFGRSVAINKTRGLPASPQQLRLTRRVVGLSCGLTLQGAAIHARDGASRGGGWLREAVIGRISAWREIIFFIQTYPLVKKT